MNYAQLNDQQIAAMLGAIGVRSIDDLFSVIPDAQRLKRPLNIPDGVSELEMLRDLRSLTDRNADCTELVCFLGAGAYDHFIPTVVDDLAGRGEFLTAYTPYQAEASQGSLQAFYEYQTMICQLTGMDVANASLYESASSAAEAVLLARGATRRNRVVVSLAVHPETRQVLDSYMSCLTLDLATVPMADGATDPSVLADAVNDDTAAVVVQSPTFFGCIERLADLARIAHDAGALLIVSVDPISCGLLKPPGDLGADLVVGEGQALGIPLGYGGPYLGFFAAKEKYLRKMPGRVVGMGADAEGRRGFCLALQTREQHIRRERATSNVCTNQGLMALRAAVYLAAMGKSGIAAVAAQCLDKAHYAAQRIAALDGYSLKFQAPFFKEFTVQTGRGVPAVLKNCRQKGILAGVPLGRWFENLADCFTVAVTEKRTRDEIDRLVDALDTA
ncbi:MAG TPA: aminomethyl-transferring glycine dehydrogenase subunit GcvPA [Phycisphaerae bacterium]|nr:aminomethyl-transferring glycine dehydrogenase subunit GcvPA [Phycisphaerae bacterium]